MWIRVNKELLQIDKYYNIYCPNDCDKSIRFAIDDEDSYTKVWFKNKEERDLEYNRIKDLLLKTNRVNPVTGE